MSVRPFVKKEERELSCKHGRWIERDLEKVEGFKVWQFTCIYCRKIWYKNKYQHGNWRDYAKATNRDNL